MAAKGVQNEQMPIKQAQNCGKFSKHPQLVEHIEEFVIEFGGRREPFNACKALDTDSGDVAGPLSRQRACVCVCARRVCTDCTCTHLACEYALSHMNGIQRLRRPLTEVMRCACSGVSMSKLIQVTATHTSHTQTATQLRKIDVYKQAIVHRFVQSTSRSNETARQFWCA